VSQRSPDGSRNRRPEGELEFELEDADGQFFGLYESDSGIGDIQLSLARELGDETGWVVRGVLKLPTGRERVLAGSGGTDLTLGILRLQDSDLRGRAAGYYFGLALIHIEQPDNVRFPVENQVMTAVLGGGMALGQRFGIKGQIDVHSAIYDSQLKEIGQTSVMATIGGWADIGETTLLEVAVSEDLYVSTTPDVVIVCNLRWKLR
jgi:hypothetical protein